MYVYMEYIGLMNRLLLAFIFNLLLLDYIINDIYLYISSAGLLPVTTIFNMDFKSKMIPPKSITYSPPNKTMQ